MARKLQAVPKLRTLDPDEAITVTLTAGGVDQLLALAAQSKATVTLYEDDAKDAASTDENIEALIRARDTAKALREARDATRAKPAPETGNTAATEG